VLHRVYWVSIGWESLEEVKVSSNPEALRDFDAFVSARGPALWRSAWLLTGDSQRAEDLVQTALLKSWPRFKSVDSFEAYVRRVMFTTYASWWARKWTGEVPTSNSDLDRAIDSEPGRDADLVAALATLTRGQRAVVVLRYFEDLTEQQTAAVMGVSVGTVKSQASRALAALRVSPLLGQERP